MDMVKDEAVKLLSWVKKQLEGENAKAAQMYRYDLQRCASVCERLIAGEVGIPQYYVKGDPTVTRQQINSVENDRTSVLNVLTIATLLTAIERDPIGTRRHGWFKSVLCGFGLVNASLSPVPPGIVPDRRNKVLDAESTTPFLEEVLRTTMKTLDAAYGSDLDGLARQHYDSDDPASLAAWSLAWSETVTATYTEWLSKGGALAVDDVLHNFMYPGTTGYRPRASTVGQGPLPTSNRRLRIEVWASPLHLQVLSHEYARDNYIDYDVHRISFNEIAERRSGTTAYEGDVKVYRTGLRIQHITATVWLERTALHLTPTESKNSLIMHTLPTCDLPTDLERDIAIGQRATVANLIERIDNPDAFKRRGAGTWFTAPPSTTARLSGVGQPSTATRQPEPFRSPVFAISAISLSVVCVIPGNLDPRSIGSVRLAWEVLHQRDGGAHWMEITFILRYAGTWHSVPMTIEEDGQDEDRVWLSVHPAIEQPWGVAALRLAFADSTWVAYVDGFGVFVAGGVDLDALAGLGGLPERTDGSS